MANVQFSGQDIIDVITTPNLEAVLNAGSVASVTNSEIRIRTTAANGEAKLEATGSGGQVYLTANNTGGDINLTCNDRMNFSAGQYWFGGTTTYNFTNDLNIDLYNYGGTDFRVIAIGNAGIYTGNPGTTTGGGDITLEAKSGDLNLVTKTGTLGTGEMKVQLAGLTPSVGQVLTAKDTAGSLEWATPGGIDFSGIDISTPADITQSTQPQYGSAVTVTAAANISNGEIVIWDYSNGTVRANIPGSLPGQSEIIGVAIEDILAGNTGKILIYGYATVSGTYSVSGDFLNQTNTINFPTGSAGSPGSTVVTLPTGADEYITLYDSGGSGSGDYGNNQVSSVRLDAGAGNTVKMKIKSFDFEYSTSGGGRLRDRLQIRVGPDANNLSNATLTPGATGSGSTNNNDGWVQMNDFFGSELVVNGPYSPSQGNVFPRDPGVGGTGPDIDDVFDLGQQVAQFDFVSDVSLEGEFEFQIASSQAQQVTNTTAGAGIYLDSINFQQATNNTSTARYIGAATGSTFANNRFVIFVAPPRV